MQTSGSIKEVQNRMNWLSAARRQKKKQTIWNDGFDFQSQRFFVATQTYDGFSGNIVANSDNSIVYALKISEKLMIVEI